MGSRHIRQGLEPDALANYRPEPTAHDVAFKCFKLKEAEAVEEIEVCGPNVGFRVHVCDSGFKVRG